MKSACKPMTRKQLDCLWSEAWAGAYRWRKNILGPDMSHKEYQRMHYALARMRRADGRAV
jgi:hypothetical protein